MCTVVVCPHDNFPVNNTDWGATVVVFLGGVGCHDRIVWLNDSSGHVPVGSLLSRVNPPTEETTTC